MHRFSFVFFVASLSLGLAGSALAAGPYVSLMGGAVILEDSDNTADTGEVITSEYDAGYLISAAGGYAFPFGLRVEGEIGYGQADFDQLTLTSGFGPDNGLSAPADGDVSAFRVMANAAYEFNLAGGFKPYLLAGLGFAQVSVDLSVDGEKIADDDDTVFAWQIGGGLAYAVAPTVDVFVDYRYFATADPSFSDVDGDGFDSEVSSHNISAGVRFTF